MENRKIANLLKAAMLLTAALGITYFVYALLQVPEKPQVRFYPGGSVPIMPGDSVKSAIQKDMPVQVMPSANINVEKHPAAKIQVAILLDVSNSMDGLIDQAKAQLWNMVNVMGNVRCDGMQPQFELALYEYGRTDNMETNGYVKQLHPFTSNLDAVSSTLFGLKTYGGDEYCPQVIVQSADQLQWENGGDAYKVIFIAGNESFRQGALPWTTACEKAKQKGVIINTIYCGSRDMGLQEHWSLGAECGNGNYTNINPDAKLEEIDTPYDSVLFVLNDKLNKTYISYGAGGESAAAMQSDVDSKNYTFNKAAAAKRVEVKSKKELYRNEEWDMVDAQEMDKDFVKKMDKQSLPPALRNKSDKEIEAYLKVKQNERGDIQRKIAETSVKRNAYINIERAKGKTGSAEKTLEMEIEKIIREQIKKYRMEISG